MVVRNDKITLAEIQQLAPKAIIISPGPGHPTDSGICNEVIQTFYKTIPLLGICLGHQAIAHSFGGVISHAAIPMHGKTSAIHHQHQGLFADLPQPFSAGRYHSLEVDPKQLPDCFVVDAHTQEGDIMAIRHRDYPVFGLQFHPESILTPVGDRLLRHFIVLAGETACSTQQ